MSEWDFTSPESRANLRRTIRAEFEGFLALASEPGGWEGPTGAGHWQRRDLVGHMVDVTENYFLGFDQARGKGEGPVPEPFVEIAQHLDAGATAFRSVPREELLARLSQDFEQMQAIFDEATDEEWGGLMVTHKFMGPLPVFMYPIFQLVDYTVHSWDMRQGTGEAHTLAAESADLLAPMILGLWSATAKAGTAAEPIRVGVQITCGPNASGHTVSVGPDGARVEPGLADGLPAVIEWDPASLVLTAYGRTRTGTVRGDRALADQFLQAFFMI